MFTTPDGRVFYFAPTDATIQPICDLASGAARSIHVWDYSFNLVALADILIAKHAAGVTIYCTLDRSQSTTSTEEPEVTALRTAGIPLVIGTSDQHQILHDKVVIVDGSKVLYGSFNLTGAAAAEVNNYCIDPEPAVVAAYWSANALVTNWCIANEPTGVTNGATPLPLALPAAT